MLLRTLVVGGDRKAGAAGGWGRGRGSTEAAIGLRQCEGVGRSQATRPEQQPWGSPRGAGAPEDPRGCQDAKEGSVYPLAALPFELLQAAPWDGTPRSEREGAREGAPGQTPQGAG